VSEYSVRDLAIKELGLDIIDISPYDVLQCIHETTEQEVAISRIDREEILYMIDCVLNPKKIPLGGSYVWGSPYIGALNFTPEESITRIKENLIKVRDIITDKELWECEFPLYIYSPAKLQLKELTK
jgi:hypothetical protein